MRANFIYNKKYFPQHINIFQIFDNKKMEKEKPVSIFSQKMKEKKKEQENIQVFGILLL